MRKNDYVIYDKPYQLNIVGVRNAETQPNKFDDSIFVFYKDDNKIGLIRNTLQQRIRVHIG